MPLTDVRIRALKPAEKPVKHSDGGGLYLLVTPQGSRLWRVAYRFHGRQKTLALGAYPVVSLAEARSKLMEARKLLAETGKLCVPSGPGGHSWGAASSICPDVVARLRSLARQDLCQFLQPLELGRHFVLQDLFERPF